VVIDGGSTDGSVDLLAKTSWPGVRWSSEPDRGQSHALNKALAVSSGEIIGWVNADDGYVDRRAVERAVECFARYPEIDVVYGHTLMVGPSNTVLQVLWAPPYLHGLSGFVTPFFQPAVFIRRALLTASFVDESLHYVMDFDLWRRLRETADFRRIPLFVGLERHQPGRKVYSAAYRAERTAYFQSQLPERDRWTARAMRISYAGLERAAGIGVSEWARRGIEPTIELYWPPSRQLWKTQLALRRDSLPFD
jgi:glycosyltransferase involved in cell wall biosynthesis